jgi:DNA-binding protein HU-beta
MSTYTKSDLLAELASDSSISRRKVLRLLDKLAEVAYREARVDGFTVPGLCRIDVIRRKARRARNPKTGETLLIAEHDMVRVRHLKKTRDMITPQPANLVTILPPELADVVEPAPVAAPAPFVAPPPVAAPAPTPAYQPLMEQPIAQPTPEEPPPAAPVRPPVSPPPVAAQPPAARPAPPPAAAPASERLISFRCKNPECRQEIEAPDDMAGTAAECPACGTPFEVPYFSEPGTLHGPALPPASTVAETPTMGRTIRIELPDDDPFA